MNRNGSILFLIFAGSSVEFFSLFPLIFPFSALIELEVLSINIQIVHIFYITVKKSNSSKKILLLPKKNLLSSPTSNISRLRFFRPFGDLLGVGGSEILPVPDKSAILSVIFIKIIKFTKLSSVHSHGSVR